MVFKLRYNLVYNNFLTHGITLADNKSKMGGQQQPGELLRRNLVRQQGE